MTTNKDIEPAKEDQVEMRTTAPSLSTDRISKDIQMTLAEIRERRAGLHNNQQLYLYKQAIPDIDTLLQMYSSWGNYPCILPKGHEGQHRHKYQPAPDSESSAVPESQRPETSSEFAVQDGEQLKPDQIAAIKQSVETEYGDLNGCKAKLGAALIDLGLLLDTRVTTPVVEENQNEAESV